MYRFCESLEGKTGPLVPALPSRAPSSAQVKPWPLPLQNRAGVPQAPNPQPLQNLSSGSCMSSKEDGLKDTPFTAPDGGLCWPPPRDMAAPPAALLCLPREISHPHYPLLLETPNQGEAPSRGTCVLPVIGK